MHKLTIKQPNYLMVHIFRNKFYDLSKITREGGYCCRSAPNSLLFIRMTAVVHHGGVGTTIAGLKYGVPSVIIHYGNDPFLRGKQV
ncbi:MAG TPA: nucleotide disphospho-sugar-binding domain-containing protein [Clostridium sp.]